MKHKIKRSFVFLITMLFTASVFSQTKIMALGESTTIEAYGYRMKLYNLAISDGLNIDMVGPHSNTFTLLSTPGYEYDSDHAGFSGYTCSLLSDTLRLFYRNYSPDIVLLLEGTNDCAWNYAVYYPQTINGITRTPITELSSLIDTICRKYPDAILFVISITPMSDDALSSITPSGVANANATDYNNAMPDMINKKFVSGKKVRFIDTRSMTISDIQQISDGGDGIHPTQNGYNKLGALVYNAIKPFISSVITGVETMKDKDVIVYPNPVTNHELTIAFNNEAQDVSLTIFNNTGVKVFFLKNITSLSSISLPQNLSTGLYFLIIKSVMFTTKKIIMIQ